MILSSAERVQAMAGPKAERGSLLLMVLRLNAAEAKVANLKEAEAAARAEARALTLVPRCRL